MSAIASTNVSRLRLGILRALYALLALGAGSLSWTFIIQPDSSFELMHGLAVCMLSAFSILCAVGVLRPLDMLPVLFWEILWKCTWLVRIGFPAWRSGTIDEGIATNLVACGLVVVVIACVPWSYAWRRFVAVRNQKAP